MQHLHQLHYLGRNDEAGPLVIKSNGHLHSLLRDNERQDVNLLKDFGNFLFRVLEISYFDLESALEHQGYRCLHFELLNQTLFSQLEKLPALASYVVSAFL